MDFIDVYQIDLKLLFTFAFFRLGSEFVTEETTSLYVPEITSSVSYHFVPSQMYIFIRFFKKQ